MAMGQERVRTVMKRSPRILYLDLYRRLQLRPPATSIVYLYLYSHQLLVIGMLSHDDSHSISCAHAADSSRHRHYPSNPLGLLPHRRLLPAAAQAADVRGCESNAVEARRESVHTGLHSGRRWPMLCEPGAP